jgi:Raf kinase inhibitor-like YbhB/YbcL family protein
MKMKTALMACLLLAGTAFAAEPFQMTSPDLRHGAALGKAQEYAGFGCQGGNTSPQLHWSGAPLGTKSFALTAYDPDAPTGSGWWHWVVFNIPADANALPRNAGDPASGLAPAQSVQSRTDYGIPGFGGACPPAGGKPHRYQFRLYALDIERLELSPDSSAALVGFMLNQHKLAVAEIEATYQR